MQFPLYIACINREIGLIAHVASWSFHFPALCTYDVKTKTLVYKLRVYNLKKKKKF